MPYRHLIIFHLRRPCNSPIISSSPWYPASKSLHALSIYNPVNIPLKIIPYKRFSCVKIRTLAYVSIHSLDKLLEFLFSAFHKSHNLRSSLFFISITISLRYLSAAFIFCFSMVLHNQRYSSNRYIHFRITLKIIFTLALDILLPVETIPSNDQNIFGRDIHLRIDNGNFFFLRWRNKKISFIGFYLSQVRGCQKSFPHFPLDNLIDGQKKVSCYTFFVIVKMHIVLHARTSIPISIRRNKQKGW